MVILKTKSRFALFHRIPLFCFWLPHVLVAVSAEVQVQGKVVDSDGNPVDQASVVVGDSWVHGPGKVRPFDPVHTDDKGAFTVKLDSPGQTEALLALDKDNRLGGIRILEKKDLNEAAVIKLSPLAHVHGVFFSQELGERPSYTHTEVYLNPGRTRVASGETKTGEFSFMLPPGEYQYRVQGVDVQDLSGEFSVAGGSSEKALGTVNLQALAIARYYGKAPPPLKITEARGVSKDVKLSDYKGKWLLVEFWAFW